MVSVIESFHCIGYLLSLFMWLGTRLVLLSTYQIPISFMSTFLHRLRWNVFKGPLYAAVQCWFSKCCLTVGAVNLRHSIILCLICKWSCPTKTWLQRMVHSSTAEVSMAGNHQLIWTWKKSCCWAGGWNTYDCYTDAIVEDLGHLHVSHMTMCYSGLQNLCVVITIFSGFITSKQSSNHWMKPCCAGPQIVHNTTFCAS